MKVEAHTAKWHVKRLFLLWLPLVILLLFLLFPFYWTFVTSIKTADELHSLTVVYWPQHPTFDAYRHLFETSNFLHPMRKSDCEKATAQFFATLRRAHEDGKLYIKGRDDELYV